MLSEEDKERLTVHLLAQSSFYAFINKGHYRYYGLYTFKERTTGRTEYVWNVDTVAKCAMMNLNVNDCESINNHFHKSTAQVMQYGERIFENYDEMVEHYKAWITVRDSGTE